MIRRKYENYTFRKISFFFSQMFYMHQNIPLPSTTHTHKQYSYSDFLLDRMGVTSHLQCNWRLSASNEGVDRKEKQGGRLQQVANAQFHQGGD
jgi:predicted transcriptional regulator